MATSEELVRVHERLDTVIDRLGALEGAVSASNALHGPCRQIVMGNGHEPIDVRMTRLETRADSARYFLHVGYAAAACVGGVLAALVPWLVPAIGRMFR